MQTILPILISGAISAAVSIGIFVGTTRTKIKNLEKSLKGTNDDLKERIKVHDELVKSVLEGRINQLEERINNMKDEVQRQGRQLSELYSYLLNNTQYFFKASEK